MKQLVIEKQITKRESKAVTSYLAEIAKLPRITPEEEVELAKKIQKGDKKALERLVNANLRFVVSVAKQYQHLGMPLEDLINEGNTGLVEAAKRFDETRGFKFISFAVWWIRQAILKAAAYDARQIRLPQNQILKLSKINRAKEELESKFEREATTEELSTILELKPDDIEFLTNSGKHPSSMDRPMVEGETFTLGDTLIDEETSYTDQHLLETSLRKELMRSLDVLNDKDRSVLELYYGLKDNQDRSVNEISRILGIANKTVYQIRDRALNRLRKSGSAEHLKNYLAAS